MQSAVANDEKKTIAITFQIKKFKHNNKHNFYSKLGLHIYKVQKKRSKNCKFNFVFFMGVQCTYTVQYYFLFLVHIFYFNQH